MLIKQISVFLENKKGRIANVAQCLGDNNIDISALSIADTTDFGILRLIVNKPDLAVSVLGKEGFTVSDTEVIAIAIDDEPGGLANALKVIDIAKISIEYLYAFVGKNSNKALVIIRVDNTEEAVRLFGKNGIEVLKAEDVYNL